MGKTIDLALENSRVRTVKTDSEVQVAVGDKGDLLRITLLDVGTHQPIKLSSLAPFEFRATNPDKNIIATSEGFQIESDGVHLDFKLPDSIYSQSGLIQDAVFRANVSGDVYSTEHFLILVLPTPGIQESFLQAVDAIKEATLALRNVISQIQNSVTNTSKQITDNLKAQADALLVDVNNRIDSLTTSAANATAAAKSANDAASNATAAINGIPNKISESLVNTLKDYAKNSDLPAGDILIQDDFPAAKYRKKDSLWINTTSGKCDLMRWNGSGWAVFLNVRDSVTKTYVDAQDAKKANQSDLDDLKKQVQGLPSSGGAGNSNNSSASNIFYYDPIITEYSNCRTKPDVAGYLSLDKGNKQQNGEYRFYSALEFVATYGKTTTTDFAPLFSFQLYDYTNKQYLKSADLPHLKKVQPYAYEFLSPNIVSKTSPRSIATMGTNISIDAGTDVITFSVRSPLSTEYGFATTFSILLPLQRNTITF